MRCAIVTVLKSRENGVLSLLYQDKQNEHGSTHAHNRLTLSHPLTICSVRCLSVFLSAFCLYSRAIRFSDEKSLQVLADLGKRPKFSPAKFVFRPIPMLSEWFRNRSPAESRIKSLTESRLESIDSRSVGPASHRTAFTPSHPSSTVNITFQHWHVLFFYHSHLSGSHFYMGKT